MLWPKVAPRNHLPVGLPLDFVSSNLKQLVLDAKAAGRSTVTVMVSHGMDTHGPTVALASMARGRDTSYIEKGGELINMKFSPGTIAGEEGTRRFMQIIRTWSQLKLHHVQFNILNRETLLAAQKDPEKYRDLVVRIAGYSAYFVDLSPSQQAEIIARTEEHA